MEMDAESLLRRVAKTLDLPLAGVRAVVALLAEDATVPFIARYRKERTGDLDEVQIRAIEEEYAKCVALEERRAVILRTIEEQGQLTPELRKALLAASTRNQLEDLYLPYKKKRKTRGSVAKERGLQPLADLILTQSLNANPISAARGYVDASKEVPDVAAALQGARDIVAEVISENVAARSTAREMYRRGQVCAKAARGKKDARSKFEQFIGSEEPVTRMPSHRLLAVLRGESEGFLKMRITIETERLAARILPALGLRKHSSFRSELEEATRDSLTRLLGPSVEKQVRKELEEKAHVEAVDVFATNLESLLLAAPLGEAPVLGIDPGLRTGCKCAMVDGTGRFLDYQTIFPDRREAAAALVALVRKHKPVALAVGNGTGGREAEVFARRALSEAKLEAIVVSVNESGASVYSASDIAREEHPDLDLTVRGAISIARRLQDPLAELVKIDPKAIGVGQYQHDVDQKLLAAKLSQVIESCVNRVGVELNTASGALLSHVAGVGPSLAKKIVAHRKKHGRFTGRADLAKVKGIGPKAFEQAAGFLRVRDGSHPLDASAVHPERYKLVEKMAKDLGTSVDGWLQNPALMTPQKLQSYVSEDVGAATLRDIVAELEKPGRDPRQSFEAPEFRDDVNKVSDLREDMILEGVVTNVTHFGAFVDIGVHQDGLVHISELANHFVAAPSDVVKAGDRVKVRVLGVDEGRGRISLSAKQV
ncbi:MAG: Tex family protein [Polyangiales bacterium]